jgi:transcriptional regulator with XRE-family HTH domain
LHNILGGYYVTEWNMSTSILGKVNRILGKEEELSRYVRRILAEKRLSLRDVQRDSGGRITQGYVGAIVNGRYANPSVGKLKALARGLGESEEKVFRVARGLSPKSEEAGDANSKGLQPLALLDLMRRIVSDRELANLVQELAELPAHARQVLLKVVRSLAESRANERPTKEAEVIVRTRAAGKESTAEERRGRRV